MLFGGYCDGDMACGHFEQALPPSVPRGGVAVLDNAAFHRQPRLQALVEAAGCPLLFLPTCSPGLNPIGNVWATLKRTLQNGLQDAKDKTAFIENTCLSLCV
jgi:transposase